MLSLHQIVLYAGILQQIDNSAAAYSLTTFLLNQTEQFRERPQTEKLHKKLAANLTVDERTTAQTRAQSLTIESILREIAHPPTKTAP